MTWQSPGRLYENEIDCFCIGKCWWSSLRDVRSQRNVNVGSDQHLLSTKCQLRLLCPPPMAHRLWPFDIAKSRQFQLELQNRFKLLAGIEDNKIEKVWSGKNVACIQTDGLKR